jgi:hypothetical protein
MSAPGLQFRPSVGGSPDLSSATLSQADRFADGLRAILARWATTKSNTFIFVVAPEKPAFSVRVTDRSDEDQRALLFTVASVEDPNFHQRFVVSTLGRGLLNQSEDADTRLFAGLRAKRECISWDELKQFIEHQATAV